MSLSKEQIKASIEAIKEITDVERLKKAAEIGKQQGSVELVMAAFDRMSELSKRASAAKDLTPLLNVELLKQFATTFKNGNTGFNANGEITIEGVKYRGEVRFAKSGMGLTKYENGQRVRYNTDGKVMPNGKPKPSLTGTYIPEARVPDWKALAERLFGRYDDAGTLLAEGICGGHYEPARVDLDPDTIRSIRSRLKDEVNERAQKIILDSFKGTLNVEQILTRCDEAQAILAEIALYEGELQQALDDLKEVAERANQVAAAALFHEVAGSGVGV